MSKDIQIEPETAASDRAVTASPAPEKQADPIPVAETSVRELRPAQSDGKPVLSLLLAISLAIVVYFAVQSTGSVVPQVVVVAQVGGGGVGAPYN